MAATFGRCWRPAGGKKKERRRGSGQRSRMCVSVQGHRLCFNIRGHILGGGSRGKPPGKFEYQTLNFLHSGEFLGNNFGIQHFGKTASQLRSWDVEFFSTEHQRVQFF